MCLSFEKDEYSFDEVLRRSCNSDMVQKKIEKKNISFTITNYEVKKLIFSYYF